ncbi:hypothetical protein FO519_008843 [Halicephalobus sp. NKZ332]|nr:hypothetical protein FO519_008843 [Halicephalobus sp. NKZ332]
MKTFFVLFVLVSIGTALIIPKNSLKLHNKDGLDCGAKSLPKFLKTHNEATFVCEICLDLIQIVVMYAECGEAYVQQELDKYCKTIFTSGGVDDMVCERLINDIMGELEKGTDVNDSDFCTKLLKSKCQYAGSIFLAIVAVSFALVVPNKGAKRQGKDGPDCGAKSAPKKLPIHKNTDIICELCLDAVQIGEMYAECDEDYQRQKMDEDCKKKLGTGTFADKLCEDIVNDIMGELESDTEANPSKVCTKLLGKPCAYAGSN